MSDTINVNGVEYVKKMPVSKGQVLVRGDRSGIHIGELVSRAGQEVVLKNTQRIHGWSGACSVSQIAVDGLPPTGQRVSVVAPENTIIDAIEVLKMTENAVQKLSEVTIWKK